MKCNHCGFENEQSAEYCVNCGERMNCQNTQTVEYVSLNPAADVVLPALQDKLFLVLCILMTVTCLMSMATSGMPLLYILFTIFLWLTYSDAQKGFANEKHLQCISGTVYASYVITNVASIIILVCGVITGAAFVFSLGEVDIIEEIINIINESGVSSPELTELITVLNEAVGKGITGLVFGIAIGVIFGVFGIMMLVLNVLATKKIHRFAKSVYMGIMYQNLNFDGSRAVKNWFIFLAVLYGITTIYVANTGVLAILTTACPTATMIIAAMLIDKYFVKQNF